MEQEAYDGPVVIILNPNGTINDLVLADSMNQETLKAITDNVITTEADITTGDANVSPISIKSLQHPIPRKDLTDVKPLMTTQVPRTIMDSVLTDVKPLVQPPRTIVESDSGSYLNADIPVHDLYKYTNVDNA